MNVSSPDPGRLTRRGALIALGGAAAGLVLSGCSADPASPGTNPTTTPQPTAPGATSAGSATRTGNGTAMPSTTGDNVIVVYFSRDGENYWNGGRRTLQIGNTKILAQQLIERLGCDSYEIRPRDEYSDDYDDAVARNVREEQANARPAIAGELPDLSGYDTVLLGSPIWNVQPPMIMHTFIEAVDWTGKTLHPFVTYAVSGLGSTIEQYRSATDRGARLDDNGLAVRGEEVRDNPGPAADWLSSIGLT